MLTNPDPHTPPGVSFPPGPQCNTVAGGGGSQLGCRPCFSDFSATEGELSPLLPKGPFIFAVRR